MNLSELEAAVLALGCDLLSKEIVDLQKRPILSVLFFRPFRFMHFLHIRFLLRRVRFLKG